MVTVDLDFIVLMSESLCVLFKRGVWTVNRSSAKPIFRLQRVCFTRVLMLHLLQPTRRANVLKQSVDSFILILYGY